MYPFEPEAKAGSSELPCFILIDVSTYALTQDAYPRAGKTTRVLSQHSVLI